MATKADDLYLSSSCKYLYWIVLAVLASTVIHVSQSTSPVCPVGTEYRNCSWNLSCSDITGVRRCKEQSPCSSGCFCVNQTVLINGTCSADINSCSVCPVGTEYRGCSWNLSCSDITGVRRCKEQSPCTSGCFCSDGMVLQDGVCSNISSCSVCPTGTEYRECSRNLSCSDITGVRRCKEESPCTSGCFCSDGMVLQDGVCSNISSCSVCPVGTEYRDCSRNLSCSDITGVRRCKEESPCASGCFCSDGMVLQDGVCSSISSCSVCPIGTEYRDCSWNLSCSDITGVRRCKEQSPCTSGCFCSDGTVLQDRVQVCSNISSCSVQCPAAVNGTLQCLNETTTARFGATCTFSCNAGYELLGSNNGTCLANQSWSGGDPICVALNCSTSPPLNNSQLQSSCDTQYQSTCTTVCVDGYTGVGGSYTCVVTDEDINSVGWNGSTSCQRVQCMELTNPTNGMISCSLINSPSFSYEDTCSFTCNTGYELTGSDTRTCQSDGSWSGADVTCSRVPCSLLNNPNDGITNCLLGDDGIPSYEDTCSFTCNTGYDLTGSSERTCQSNGSWSGSPVSCIVIECPSSSLPMNSMLAESCSSTYQSMCELQCQEGFNGTGDPSYVCDVLSNGSSVMWMADGVTWRCERVQCPTLMNGNVRCPNNDTTGVFGDSCTFFCNAGYELQGSDNGTCLANQSWSGGNSTCVALNCSISPPLNNSQLQSSCDTQYQSTCTTVCVDGYTGVGGSYTCVVTDEDTNSVGWNGSTSCQRVQCMVLTNPINGMISCSLINSPSFSYEDTCNFTCNTGYELTGSDTRTCQSDGSWSGTDVTCNRVSCSSLTNPNNGMINCSLGDDGVSSYEDTCSFTCNTGYELTGSNERTCQSDGSWSGSPVSCIIMECPSSSLPMNSMLAESCNSTYQSMCELQCQEGFNGTGDPSYVCDVLSNGSSVMWMAEGDAWRCERACPAGTEYRECSWSLSCSDITGVRRCKELSPCTSGCFCSDRRVFIDGICTNISSCSDFSTTVIPTMSTVTAFDPTASVVVVSLPLSTVILPTSASVSSINNNIMSSKSVVTSSSLSLTVSSSSITLSSVSTTSSLPIFINTSNSLSSILPSVKSSSLVFTTSILDTVMTTTEITAATADAASSDDSGSLSAASIGGAVGGVVVFIIIVVLCIVICCIIRSKRNKKGSLIIGSNTAIYYNKTYDNVNNITDTKPHTVNATPSLTINNPLPALESSFTETTVKASMTIQNEWADMLAICSIDYNTLMIEKEIAKGNFGVVYKGHYTNEDKTVEVAIKTMKDVSLSNAKEFIDECITASNFNHPNVLSIIGVSINPDDDTPLMVMPFMHNGSVQSFVKSKRRGTVKFNSFPVGLSHQVLMELCLDIARGMEYLSSRRFVHRDLAARNCMLDQKMTVKVADFGLARDIYTDSYYATASKKKPLPIKWLAPEALLDRVFTEKTDVWAFGVTCWEVFSLGLHPYPSITASEVFDYVKNGGTLDKPQLLNSDEMYETMRSCWKFSPEERPNFTALVQNISQQLGHIDDDLYLHVQ